IGFNIVEVNDGQGAIDQTQKIQPDLLFTALAMPKISGFEAVKRIRQVPALQGMPIIAVSANVFELNKGKSLEAGCNAFLASPIEEKLLFELLEKHLGIKLIYENATAPVNGRDLPEHDDQTLIPPPPEELEALYQLAMLGSLQEIQTRAAQVERLDEKYGPFTNRLCSLAKEFEDAQIIRLLEQHMEKSS
ncbi:MAG: response regulator, partial [Anaerolineae bacterium]|nr:response regulator [Anaerolineae bacterium]